MCSEEQHAKIAKLIESAIQKIVAVHEKKLHGARLDFLVRVIPALICARSLQYHKIAAEMAGDVLESSKTRRICNFVNDYELDYDMVAYFLILLLPPKARYRLCIDRTEWAFGACTYNMLVVTAYSHGIGIPIWFEPVAPNGGCSDADDKQYVIMACVRLLGADRIKCVLGDSEFIGQAWISYLCAAKISFFFDIRSNQEFEYKGKTHTTKTWMWGKQKAEIRNIGMYGYRLNIGIKRQKTSKKVKVKPFLSIITNQTTVNGILSIYKNRWSIEVFFQAMKGRGFDIESTHIRSVHEFRRLFALACMAFVLCLVVGIYKDKIEPIALKNHGYKANSFFRTGMDFIRQMIHQRARMLNQDHILQRIFATFVTIFGQLAPT